MFSLILWVCLLMSFDTVRSQERATWAGNWKKVGEIITYWRRVIGRNNGILEDHPDCGISPDIPLGVNEARFGHECWEACDWTDTPNSFRYQIFTYSFIIIIFPFSIPIVITEPRIPANWNCFFDGCYKDFETFIDTSLNTLSNNLCTRLGFIFTAGTPFRTRLQNLVKCYLFSQLRLSNGFHISRDKNVVALMVTYSLIFLEKTSETYSGIHEKRRKKKSFYSILKRLDDKYVEYSGSTIKINSKLMKYENKNFRNLGVTGNNLTRLIGPAVGNVDFNNVAGGTRKWPWSCSLRSSGFRSFHKCGVTLLSGPPKPTVLVSSAHCNYVCKDGNGRMLESCCCSNIGFDDNLLNCRKSPHCTADAKSYLAKPQDLLIICGEETTRTESLFFSEERETILPIKEIIIHPWYKPDKLREGYDIAVYIVDDTNLKNGTFFNRNNIWPACLPKQETDYVLSNGKPIKGYTAGWDIGDSFSRFQDTTGELLFQNLADRFGHKEAQMERVPCSDIEYNGARTNTYYPPRSVCFRDPTYQSCPNFGTSGSGIVRRTASSGFTRYSFQGPMSFHRGCLQINIESNAGSGVVIDEIIRQSFNPTVYADALCFLPWIAAMYGMRMPKDFRKPDYCSNDLGRGDPDDRDKSDCLSAVPFGQRKPCDFQVSKEMLNLDRCSRTSTEEVEALRFQCATSDRDVVPCSNNCLGVSETAVIVGGGIIASTTALTAAQFLAPLSMVASAFLINMSMNRQRNCPEACRLGAGECIRGRRCTILQNNFNK